MDSINAGELRLFEGFDIDDKVTSVDVEKSAETALMETLEESWVASIDDPRLGKNFMLAHI